MLPMPHHNLLLRPRDSLEVWIPVCSIGFCVRGRSLTLGTSLGGGLVVPLTPSTPTTPTTPTDPNTPTGEGSGRSKKTNPLTDLIETEKVYVELLTGIIRVSHTLRC